MKYWKKYGAISLTGVLCLAALVFSVMMNQAGYLTYLNSDMASETILARRQVDTGSLVQMDWLYSTEIHSLHMNLFYALAFFFTPDYHLARIIGNTLVFILGMAALVFLGRTMKLSWAQCLAIAAMLPVAAGSVYAENMTIGGYYIIHLPISFFATACWLRACFGERRRRIWQMAFVGMCLLMGLLSVRYVLCFVCPMVVVAVMAWLTNTQESRKREASDFARVTGIGFVACLAGFAASEVLVPRLFMSGIGSAESFTFNALDGQQMLAVLIAVGTDFLKILGWRGEAVLFSLEGVVNLCMAAVLFLGAVMTTRACRVLRAADTQQEKIRWVLVLYAFAVFCVNLFTFVFIKGTYLNRYLILALLFFVPMTAVVADEEKSKSLARLFVLLLCAGLTLSGALLYRDTRRAEQGAVVRGADMMDAATHLTEQGYTHGYGTFWHVRVMQERTGGALTFTGVRNKETEANALCPYTLELIRWLEPDEASHADYCPGKTFLILTGEEQAELMPWLRMCNAPVLYRNATYVVYGFESSQALTQAMLLGEMTLENAKAEEGRIVLRGGGRLRMPPAWREAGRYNLTFEVEGEPEIGSVVQAYAHRNFEKIAEQTLLEGKNALSCTLEQDDPYFMLQIRAADDAEIFLSEIRLIKE